MDYLEWVLKGLILGPIFAVVATSSSLHCQFRELHKASAVIYDW
jgi:hypothetical protein